LINIVESSIEEVLASVGASAEGLSSSEASARLLEVGPNETPRTKTHLSIRRFFAYLLDGFSVLLLIAGILLYISGTPLVALVVFGIVILNATASVVQEIRAERTMDALKGWVPESAKVLRDGHAQKVTVRDIVPGDVISLDLGDRVPADARLMEAYDVWVNNIPLTGEAAPQPRTADPRGNHGVSYLEAPNLVFMSTSIVRGHGRAVVYATGANTKFGEIAGLTQRIRDPPSPLEEEIASVARKDFVLSMILGIAFLFITMTWLHLSLYDGILLMIGVMISLVPEGLQLTVSSALAISSLQMARQNVLVKRLSAVETLGSVTVICTDKTGTITKGEMTVRKLYAGNMLFDVSGLGYHLFGVFSHGGRVTTIGQSPALDELLMTTTLCNSAELESPEESKPGKGWTIIGDPMDGALLIAAVKYGLDIEAMRTDSKLVRAIPFSSERRRETTVCSKGSRVSVFMKGAPSTVFPACTKALAADGTLEEFTPQYLSRVDEVYQNLARAGLRVLACAYAEGPAEALPEDEDIEHDMVFVGLAALYDPPRNDVQASVLTAKNAGIEIVVMTGDSEITTEAIAAEVGIANREGTRPMLGEEMQRLNDSELVQGIREGSVLYARVSPTDKFRIVKALKDAGETIAVTGDGANDAPSLKLANIGIAMGASGTDIARESSDLVLLDDSFTSIVKAIESGRAIYDNIRRFIVYVFSHNWAELISFLTFVLFSIPLPLLVMQVLAIDLFIEILPALAISREPSEPGTMGRPPRSAQKHLLDTAALLRSLYVGTIIGVASMMMCLMVWTAAGWKPGMTLEVTNPVYIKGTTMTFAGIVFGQVANVLSCRTDRVSIFRTSRSRNKWIPGAIGAQVGILAAIVYSPWLQPIFGTIGLGLVDWGYLLLITATVIVAEELRKLVYRTWRP
jgi:magnesium-transporting ATPase (P-type)